MQHLYLYNQHNNPEKTHSRLIFFADRKEQKSSDRLMTVEQERYLKELEQNSGSPYAKEIAAQYRAGKIETEVLQEVREVLKDPNKMQRDDYRYFMKALAKGKFPNRAKHALQFLRALKGSKRERDYAQDLVKNLSEDSVGPLSERREKAHLKELADLKHAEIAATLTQTAAIGSAIRVVSETSEKNWKIEQAEGALIETLDRLETAQFEIAKKANEKDAQLDQALKAEKPDEALIARLKKEITELDRQFDELAKELESYQLEFENYLARNLARYRALESFLDRAGIDINEAKKLKMWFLELSGRKTGTEAGSTKDDHRLDTTTSLKMEGIEIDPVTGKARKKEGVIEITGIRFEKNRTDLEEESPGELIIEYTNERGEATYANYKIFLQMIHTFEAYEEVDSLDGVNERLAEEIGYSELASGQQYSAQVLVGLDKTGKELRETHQFVIQEIDAKHKKIILDHSVVKIPRQWIAYSVHPTLYFDRTQKEFSFGEFIKLVKQHKYQRTITVDETESALVGSQEKLQADCAAFVVGATPDVKRKFEAIGGIPKTDLSLPQTGESADVYFLDEYRQRRRGVLSRTKLPDGGETFTLEAVPAEPGASAEPESLAATGTDNAIATGIPLSIATAKPGQGRWHKKNLDARALLQMANKGDISSAAMSEVGLDTPSSRVPTQENIPSEGEIEQQQRELSQPEKSGKGPRQKIYEEALPYDAVYKVGGMETKERSLLKAMWTQTRFLSFDDFWEMGKAMWEYYDRRFQRRQKDRYSAIGTKLPFFAPEMRRINQSTETEQVNQFKESFEQKGVFEIIERLVKTHNRDEMKSCFIALSAKGQLRWDDIELWRNLNRFVSPDNAIPLPSNGDPYTRVSREDNRTGFDFLKGAVDSLWGEGQYNDWFRQNKSTFQSNAKGYYEEGKELEGVDGGHARRLAVLLQQHKEGQFVDPHEYEGLILHAIEYGKSRMQPKIYYMIEGVAAVNGQGRTILPFERMAHLNSEMLTRFPLLEYLCASVPRPDGKGYHRFTMDDYKRWVRMFDEGDPLNPEKCKPGEAVDKFMWDYVLPSDETQNRINKALRNGETMDHDDMFAYIPPATEEVVTDVCKATTGSKKFLTLEGYANAFPGFSQYMSSLAGRNNRNKLREAIKSYVRFEGIMKNRFEKEKDVYQRMSYATLNSATIVTDTPPQAFIDQINPMIQQIMDAYDDPELNETFRLIRTETGDIFSDPNQRDLQNRVNNAFRRFGDVFTRVIKSDNGEKMTAVVAGTTLEGMPFGMSDEKIAQRKAAYSDQFALE